MRSVCGRYAEVLGPSIAASESMRAWAVTLVASNRIELDDLPPQGQPLCPSHL
jgi:hypothetical protein